MSGQKPTISWHDLTVKDAGKVSDFYCAVAGWTKEGFNMGDYEDYVMKDAAGNVVAGVCNAKGGNANIPPYWLMYVHVTNIDERLVKCKELGGTIIGEKKKMGPSGVYCLIQDPAGAYVMLCEGDFGM